MDKNSFFQMVVMTTKFIPLLQLMSPWLSPLVSMSSGYPGRKCQNLDKFQEIRWKQKCTQTRQKIKKNMLAYKLINITIPMALLYIFMKKDTFISYAHELLPGNTFCNIGQHRTYIRQSLLKFIIDLSTSCSVFLPNSYDLNIYIFFKLISPSEWWY